MSSKERFARQFLTVNGKDEVQEKRLTGAFGKPCPVRIPGLLRFAKVIAALQAA